MHWWITHTMLSAQDECWCIYILSTLFCDLASLYSSYIDYGGTLIMLTADLPPQRSTAYHTKHHFQHSTSKKIIGIYVDSDCVVRLYEWSVHFFFLYSLYPTSLPYFRIYMNEVLCSNGSKAARSYENAIDVTKLIWSWWAVILSK